jgi:hypothetical protein
MDLDLYGLIEVASDILAGVSTPESMVFGPSTSEIWDYYDGITPA